jgi:hypothetical protein
VSGAPWSIASRVAEFYRRLASLPPARSADEAFRQICDTLEQVEDELSGIPKRSPPPPPEASDGRMYPPRDDKIQRAADGSIITETRRQRVEIGTDGSICIRRKKLRVVEFAKPGGHYE